MNQRARTLETLRRVRRQLSADEQTSFDEAIHAVTDLYNQDTALRQLLKQWTRLFGAKDGCVRGLAKIINGEKS